MFDREECTYKAIGSCTCLDCSKEPVVVIAPEDNSDSICYQHNVTLRNVREFIDGGMLGSICKDDSLIVYSQTQYNRTQIGVCAGISINDCVNGTVKCHEMTIQHQDTTQRKHLVPKGVDPIMVMYRQNSTIDDIVSSIMNNEKPVLDFNKTHGTDPSIFSTHKLWIVKRKEDIASITQAFEGVQSLYIADGHHRTADACRKASLNKSNPNKHSMYIMAMLFPHSQLSLVPFNRYIRSIDIPISTFLERVSKSFNIIEEQEYSIDNNNSNRPSMRMYADGRWFVLEKLDSIDIDGDDPISSIDSQILCDHLLKPALGVVSPSLDPRIGYVSGSGSTSMAKLSELVDTGVATVAFAMTSISVDDIMKIADTGKLLPPKASCFDPKPLRGLMVRLH